MLEFIFGVLLGVLVTLYLSIYDGLPDWAEKVRVELNEKLNNLIN